MIYCGGSDVCKWFPLFLVSKYDLHVCVAFYLLSLVDINYCFFFVHVLRVDTNQEKKHVVFYININCLLLSLAGIFNYILEISYTMLINIDRWLL